LLVVLPVLLLNIVPLKLLRFLNLLSNVVRRGPYLFIILLQPLIFLAFISSITFDTIIVNIDVYDGFSFLIRCL